MTYTGVGEQQRVGAGSTSYQYDATGLSQQSDSSGSSYFTSLPDGTVISETVSGSTYYYLSDGAGSVAALTDSGGAVKNTYAYDPLGNVTSSTGTTPNPFTFQGGMDDSRTGFYYTGSGYYDPSNGQSFGCQDQGWVDPGEDLCGEDEGSRGTSGADPSIKCTLAQTGYVIQGPYDGSHLYIERLGFDGAVCNKTFSEGAIVVRVQKHVGDTWVSVGKVGCRNVGPVYKGESFSCVQDTLITLGPGAYRVRWGLLARSLDRRKIYNGLGESCEFFVRVDEPPVIECRPQR
ncbi:MAG TPA: hypothetical protein VF898_07985 [Chloroflexota bacterium]